VSGNRSPSGCSNKRWGGPWGAAGRGHTAVLRRRDSTALWRRKGEVGTAAREAHETSSLDCSNMAAPGPVHVAPWTEVLIVEEDS